MSISKISSYVFLGSLFALVFTWGYLPKFWIQAYVPWSLLGLSCVGLISWIVFSLEQIMSWFKKRSTQFGLSLLISAVAMLGILGTVNWLAVKFNKKKDFTANKLHTLSDQSQRVLAGLKEEVTLRVWSTRVAGMSANLDMENFLENFKIAAKGKLKLEVKNPNEDRVTAVTDGIKKDNVIIIRASSGRETRIESFTDSKGEEQILNAIVQAIKGAKKTICFLSGHKEYSINESGPEGISSVKQRLEDSSFSTQEISLLGTETVPAGCEALVIAGPQTEPGKDEIAKIQKYLDQGGRMLAMISAGAPASWRNLTAAYGVKLRENIVLDPQVQPPVVVHSKNFARDVDWIAPMANSVVLLPFTSSWEVPAKSADEKVSIKTFLSSESVSFAKAGSIRSLGGAVGRSGSDLKGPLPVGVMITKTLEETKPAEGAKEEKPVKKETAIVLIGSHQFASNSVVTQVSNIDLFMNSISFLSRDQDLIGVRAKEIRQASLDLKPENLRQVYASLLMVALLFLVGGIATQRRRQVTA